MHKEGFDVKDGQQVTVTSDDKAEASSSVLPITYPHFAHMCQPGDTLFVGRYLVNGADQSSLYLEVGYIIRMPSPPLVASYRGLKPAIYVLNEFRRCHSDTFERRVPVSGHLSIPMWHHGKHPRSHGVACLRTPASIREMTLRKLSDTEYMCGKLDLVRAQSQNKVPWTGALTGTSPCRIRIDSMRWNLLAEICGCMQLNGSYLCRSRTSREMM